MKIRVGAADPKSIPIDIQEGDEFEYDGQLLKYAGSEIHTPQLRGAIRNGWVTTDQDNVGSEHVSTVQLNRNIAKAQTVNKDMSRVQRSGPTQLDTDSLDEETVLNVSDRRDSSKNSRATPQVIKSENNRRAGMRVEGGIQENQDAVTIGRVRSPAKIKVDIDKSSGMTHDIENRGLGQPELFENKVIEREGVRVTTNVGNLNRNVQAAQEEDGEVVGQVRTTRTSSSDGIEVKDTSSIRNKTSGAPVNKSQPVKIDTTLSPKIRMARRIDPGFPSNWMFSGRLADRLEAVKQHGDTPEFLEALYAAEGDQMRKALEKAYPGQFGG
jgi:hypothetical protein